MKKMVYTIVVSILVIGFISVIFSLVLESKNHEINGLKTEINNLLIKVKGEINNSKEKNSLDQENKTLKNNLIDTLVEKKYWFVIDKKTISSEPNGKGVIIYLTEELKEIRYSDSKSGFQKPKSGTKILFERAFSDEDVGNKLFNDRLIYNYIY